MSTCLNTDEFQMVFILCLQKVQSLLIGKVALGNIVLDCCECVCPVDTFQVPYPPHLNVYPLFPCITFNFNPQNPYPILLKLIFHLVWEARMPLQLDIQQQEKLTTKVLNLIPCLQIGVPFFNIKP